MTTWSPSSDDALELLDPAEVDDLLRGVEPHPQDGQEALAAGHHLGVVAGLGQRREGVGDRGGGEVVERCGDHWPAPSVEAPASAPGCPGWGRRRRSAAGPRPVAASAWLEPADWMAFQTRSGVHGIWMSLMPSGRRASTTALTTAGVEAMRARLADALGAEVLVVDGEVVFSVTKADRVGGGRQGVVDERAGHQGALVVEDGLLPQRLRDALDDASVHLPLDDERVDDLPMSSTETYLRIVTWPVSVSTSMAHRCVPWGKEKLSGSKVASASMLGSTPSGRLCEVNCAVAISAIADPVVGAPHREPALRELHVVDRWPRGGGQRRPWPSRSTLSAASHEGLAAHDQRARAVGVEATRRDLGVAVEDLDVLEGHTQPVGDDLAPGRLVALAVG